MHERGFRVKKDFIISGRGEGEEGGNPNLGLGFTSDIQLLDAKGKNTSNVNTTAPWDTVTTRTDHGLELSKSLLHGNSGLIYLVQTTHLTHFILFSSYFGGKKVGWVDGFCFSITSELFLFCCCNNNFNPKPSTKSANTHHTQHNSLSTWNYHTKTQKHKFLHTSKGQQLPPTHISKSSDPQDHSQHLIYKKLILQISTRYRHWQEDPHQQL